MSVLLSQFIPLLPRCVHTSVLDVRVSIPALQIGSSVPFFQIPHIYVDIFILLFLFSLCMTDSGSIHSSTNDPVLFLLWLSNIPLSMWTMCTYSLSSSVVSDSLWSVDCSLSGFSVHGIFQVRILEWVTFSSSRGYSWPRDRTHIFCVSCIGRQILYHWATWKDIHVPHHLYSFSFWKVKADN